MNDISTVEGKIGNQKYIFTSKPDLEEIPFVEAMKDKKRSFYLNFQTEKKLQLVYGLRQREPKHLHGHAYTQHYLILGKKFL